MLSADEAVNSFASVILEGSICQSGEKGALVDQLSGKLTFPTGVEHAALVLLIYNGIQKAFGSYVQVMHHVTHHSKDDRSHDIV